jgi:hypothetical protein
MHNHLRKSNILTILLSFLGIITLSRCTAADSSQNYSVSSEALTQICKQVDTSIIIFYTSWCGGYSNIETLYTSYLDKINEKSINAQVILLACDDDLADSIILKWQNRGFVSYRIAAGNNAWTNRRSIKKIIKEAFPNESIKGLNAISFPIPVELWVTESGKVLNKEDIENNTRYSDWLLDVKTINITKD